MGRELYVCVCIYIEMDGLEEEQQQQQQRWTYIPPEAEREVSPPSKGRFWSFWVRILPRLPPNPAFFPRVYLHFVSSPECTEEKQC